MLDHLAHAGVSGPIQAPAERVEVEAVAAFDPEPMAVDEAARCNPHHRGADRGHQHPGGEGRQPRGGVQPFRDDVLMGREQVVGQRLPVGESQEPGRAVQVELQLGFEAVRGLVVRGDHHHRRTGPLHEVCDGKAAGAAVKRRPSDPRSRGGQGGSERGDGWRGGTGLGGAFAARSGHGSPESMVRPSVATPGRRPAEPPLLAGRDAVAVAMAFAELEFRDSLTEMDSRHPLSRE